MVHAAPYFFSMVCARITKKSSEFSIIQEIHSKSGLKIQNVPEIDASYNTIRTKKREKKIKFKKEDKTGFKLFLTAVLLKL